MTKDEKRAEIEHIKKEACTAKDRLGYLYCKLDEIGAVREAKSLLTIIYKLEAWQNK